MRIENIRILLPMISRCLNMAHRLLMLAFVLTAAEATEYQVGGATLLVGVVANWGQAKFRFLQRPSFGFFSGELGTGTAERIRSESGANQGQAKFRLLHASKRSESGTGQVSVARR